MKETKNRIELPSGEVKRCDSFDEIPKGVTFRFIGEQKWSLYIEENDGYGQNAESY